MSETFEKILVKDDRLGCISPKVKYQVLKGGQNITCQTYNGNITKHDESCVQRGGSKSGDNH